jgi:hypothetical protein
VNVAVEKWKTINLAFIKQLRFNELRFRFFLRPNRPIAPKKGIDNLQANLYGGSRRRLKGLA